MENNNNQETTLKKIGSLNNITVYNCVACGARITTEKGSADLIYCPYCGKRGK